MSTTPVVMPRLGLTMEEGTCAAWLKAEGDYVEKDEPLFEVEIDKGRVTVEAQASGYLRGWQVALGTTVPIGHLLAYLSSTADEPLPGVVGLPAPATADPSPAAASGPRRVLPAAKRRARELGVEAEAVPGTGPDGAVTVADVEAFVKGGAAPGTAAPIAAPVSQVGRHVTVSRMRKAVADLMTESQRNVPQFAVETQVDVTAVLRKVEAVAQAGIKLSLTDYLIEACARALREHPAVNGSYADAKAGGEATITYHEAVQIGLATGVDDGVVVPVIANADKLNLSEIATQRKAAVQRALSGQMLPADFGTATFTISNLGPFGVHRFNAIVIPPQAAILAVGAVQPQPAVVGGQVVSRPMLSFTLSVDHRILDGVAAAKFLQTVVQNLHTNGGTA